MTTSSQPCAFRIVLISSLVSAADNAVGQIRHEIGMISTAMIPTSPSSVDP